MENQFAKQLSTIYQTNRNLFAINAAMTFFLEDIHNAFSLEIHAYSELRDEYNTEHQLAEIALKEITTIKQLLSSNNLNVTVIDTSSIKAGTSIICNSDIDLSILIDDISTSSKPLYDELLTTLGYTYSHLVNPNQPRNCYHSYTSTRCYNTVQIEFEIKLRNKIESQTILELHRYIEYDVPQLVKKIVTFGKYMFMILSTMPNNHQSEKISYALFKKLVYEMFFCNVSGGFLLEAHH